MTPEDKVKIATETYTLLYKGEKASSYTEKQKMYNPQNEMLPFHKTKCSETQNEASSL